MSMVNKNFKKQSYKGFTLIELILVTAIIGLFAAGVIAVINPSQQVNKANDAKRKSDLATIQRALEAYYADNGRYPQAINNKIYAKNATVNWGTSWQPYIDLLPKDPSTGRTYVYGTSADGQRYGVYASLEKASDPQLCNTNGSACSSLSTFGINASPGSSCGKICNFGVTSADLSP